MLKRMVLGLLFVLVPSAGWTQTLQESYLPPKTQVYFRFDGMATHQAAFDQTAVGKMMQGDTGKFLTEFWKYAEEQLQNLAKNEPKAGPLLKDFTKLVGAMHQNGIVFALDVEQVRPLPVGQMVLVFPKGAGESGTLLPLVTKIAEETKAEVKNAKVGKRFVNYIEYQKIVKFGWWAQGEDALLYLGTTDPVDYAKDIDAKKTGIASNPLYKKVAGFKEFKSASRGYFDMTSVLKVASEIDPRVGKVIDELGVKGIKNITFASGFDGPAERSIVDVDMPGPRTGLLAFSTQMKISMKDLPVLPADLKNFQASAIKVDKTYGTLINLVNGIAGIVVPDKAEDIKEAIKAFEGALGVNLDTDLFGSFGEVLVSYSSPSDGILGTGAVVAIQLKDGKKLAKTINKLVQAVPVIPGGGEVSLTRKAYYGGDVLQLSITGPAQHSHIAAIGIYKDWFVYSNYPQAVKGFILRQEGKLPAWKADADLSKALAKFPKEFTTIQVSDPRPTVKTVIAALPFLVNLGNTFGTLGAQFGGIQGFRPFDLDYIPHAEEATLHLFPNVTVGVDDGKRIRTETRGSLILPFGL